MLLVIDDEPDVRASLLELLNLNGYSGRSAANGRAALQALRARPALPKLILLDMAMPVLDGWGFLAELSKDPRLALIPVIVISATPGLEMRAEAAGASAVLRKPVNLEVLLSAVDRCLHAA
jgi:two-component system, chemotaxis family, chemotaxis protein CheY